MQGDRGGRSPWRTASWGRGQARGRGSRGWGAKPQEHLGTGTEKAQAVTGGLPGVPPRFSGTPPRTGSQSFLHALQGQLHLREADPGSSSWREGPKRDRGEAGQQEVTRAKGRRLGGEAGGRLAAFQVRCAPPTHLLWPTEAPPSRPAEGPCARGFPKDVLWNLQGTLG